MKWPTWSWNKWPWESGWTRRFRKKKKREKKARERKLASVKVFKMTVSVISYNDKTHKVEEYEMYFTIQCRAKGKKGIKRVRKILAKKGKAHYIRWINKHTNFDIMREVTAKFEREFRAKDQKPWNYAAVDRMKMIYHGRERQWSGENLPSGSTPYGKIHGKRRKR